MHKGLEASNLFWTLFLEIIELWYTPSHALVILVGYTESVFLNPMLWFLWVYVNHAVAL